MGEGKTVDEAIDKALMKLQVEREQVEVEVVQEPSRSFFGLRHNTAVVRLHLKASSKVDTLEVGVVSISGGKLEYTPPSKGGRVPTIHFGSELRVFYHGEQQEQLVQLSDGIEPLEIQLPEERQPELDYEIKVDSKQVTAELFWKRTPGVVYALADHPPTNQLTLALTQTMVEAPALKPADVHHLVQIEGITHGLQLDALTDEALRAPKGLYPVALGINPKPGQEPSVTYVFQEEELSIDDDALRIDHYAVHGTEGVQEGALLAVKDPGKPGVAGIDVYGQPIPPQPLRNVELHVGEGTKLTEDGLAIVATTSGLPSVQNGLVRVTQVFELSGDADVSTGNITMDGDIIIKGNVLDNVKVQSNTGIIVVNGLVSGATLRTGGSITVMRNVVRSQLYAGGASVNQIRLMNLLQKIADQLEALVVAYETIVAQAHNIPFENLIRHLIELKFTALPKHVSELTDELAKISASSEEEAQQFASLRETIDGCLFQQDQDPLQINDLEQLQVIRNIIAERVVELENMKTVVSDIKMGYLQNSRIEASGNVQVTGKGCFYSTVLAGSGFSIASGVFRGGQVTVNAGTITAKELGGPTGIATRAHVLRRGQINATLVHPNVRVMIGSQSYKFDETTSLVKVFSDGNTLTVYSGSNKIYG